MRSIHGQAHLVLASLILAGPVFGQAAATKAAPAETMFGLNFNGGTLEEYVTLVKRQASDANIVIDRGLEKVKLPKAPLPKLSLPLALQWVQTVTEARKRGLILQSTRSGRDAGVVFVFTTAQYSVARSQPAEDHQVKVYALPPVEEGQSPISPEMVRLAVENALGKQASEVKGSAEYNKETRMLTVTGSRSDIALADQVIAEITRGRHTSAELQGLKATGAEVQTLKADVNRLKAQVESLTKAGIPPARP